MEHDVSAHPCSSEDCVSVNGVIVRSEVPRSGSCSTAEEFWIGFVSQQAANVVPPEVETHGRTFSLPLWPSLPSSAPSVAFADDNGYVYIVAPCSLDVYCEYHILLWWLFLLEDTMYIWMLRPESGSTLVSTTCMSLEYMPGYWLRLSWPRFIVIIWPLWTDARWGFPCKHLFIYQPKSLSNPQIR